MSVNIKRRVSAIIIKDKKILLMHRIKKEKDYYTLIGGSVERGEGIEDAMIREIKEESSVDVKIDRLLFEIKDDRENYYFLIKDFSGDPKLGGPEAERMNENNQYHLEWINLDKFRKLKNFYPNPTKAQKKLLKLLDELLNK